MLTEIINLKNEHVSQNQLGSDTARMPTSKKSRTSP